MVKTETSELTSTFLFIFLLLTFDIEKFYAVSIMSCVVNCTFKPSRVISHYITSLQMLNIVSDNTHVNIADIYQIDQRIKEGDMLCSGIKLLFKNES